MGLLDKLLSKQAKTAINATKKAVKASSKDSNKSGERVTFNERESTTYISVEKGSREVFDGELIGSNSTYWVAEGYKGDSEALAFGDATHAIRYKSFDDSVVGCIVYNDTAIVIGEESACVLSKDSASTRTFEYGNPDDSQRVLTNECAAYIDDNDECLKLKCLVFETLEVWTKPIQTPKDDVGYAIYDDCSLTISDSALVVTVNGVAQSYDLTGKLM